MTHKEIKKDIHNKLEAALVELKTLIGDKKFNNRIKKASKLLAEGLGKDEKPETAKEETSKAAAPAKKELVTKMPAKKAAAKKSPVKKAVIPVAKKATKSPVSKKKIVAKGK